MTQTKPHRLIYQKSHFNIIGVDGEGLFHPTNYGIKTIPTTACGGFNCTYNLINDILQLKEVYLNLDSEDEKLIKQGKGIKLFNQVPSPYIEKDHKGKEFVWYFRCENLNELIYFTGGILVGCDYVHRTYMTRGLPLPHTFYKVHELVFDSGKLIEATDCSQKMSQFRNMLADPEISKGTQQWLEDCFSFYYYR